MAKVSFNRQAVLATARGRMEELLRMLGNEATRHLKELLSKQGVPASGSAARRRADLGLTGEDLAGRRSRKGEPPRQESTLLWQSMGYGLRDNGMTMRFGSFADLADRGAGSLKYAAWLESGTDPHPQRKRNSSETFQHPGMGKRPYLAPTFDHLRTKVRPFAAKVGRAAKGSR